MTHRFTSTRRSKTVSAAASLCAAAALAAGVGLWTAQASGQTPARPDTASVTVAGSIVPSWNNTGSSIHPPEAQS
ncbi:hypothetical protein [Streptomyces sp. NPDC101132]|uniref:hypothetical protein n=1 Tax=Streptomyces sp. NPDC101132 TaxID=3366110 RepID=UPI00382782DB